MILGNYFQNIQSTYKNFFFSGISFDSSEIKKNNILDLKNCILYWCKVSKENINGWILKKNIWGIYEFEIYNDKFYQPIVNLYWKILNSKFLN